MKSLLPFLAAMLTLVIPAAQAQTTNIIGPAGGSEFGKTVVVLTNGNYVVIDPYWDNGATADVGAVYLYNGSTHALISTLTGSTPSDYVGIGGVTVLTNGNYIINSSYWDNGAATDAGAVTWGSGTTGIAGVVSSSNSLVGSTADDNVGTNVAALSNGNYVVSSLYWDNGAATDAGAVTWGSGTTGVSGIVSSSNSLVGSTAFDNVGTDIITVLSNGNYVVNSYFWDNGAATDAGAVTWGSGTTGVSGTVSSSNSLVGSTADNYVGFNGITELSNGNYVICSSVWDNETTGNVGAVTWGSGTTGIIGIVSSSNSLVGSTADDNVGIGGVTALTNGNYVVSSREWDNGTTTDAGAATWGSGTTGVSGAVSSSNSLVGSTANDNVGSSITPLSNGNYVVSSREWDNGTTWNAGAVTWGNGTTGISGAVSSGNSLVGSTFNDNVGNGGATALSNGNYVVSSYDWDNGTTAANAGAVTWGSGTTGVSGAVSSSNSLVGSTADNQVGNGGVTALSNGNYVVSSPFWDNGTTTANVGAVTWGSGTTGIAGVVSSSNSLVGSTADDYVGRDGITELSNGNYVVTSNSWDNGAATNAGAVTWGSGTTGIAGVVSSGNSLVGNTADDRVGNSMTVLSNGNYVVSSYFWNNGAATNAGAVTWGSGTTGIAGVVSSSNSLVGNTADNQVGSLVTELSNGNYVVSSYNWDNGAATNAGAVTWGSGTTGIAGVVSSSNSLVGNTADDQVGSLVIELSNGNYVVSSLYWDNGTDTDAGAVTWGSGTTGVSGAVSSSNSLVGSTANEQLGYGDVTELSNGNYVVSSPYWDNGTDTDAGAVTWGSGALGITGTINTCNSVVGNVASSLLYPTDNPVFEYVIVGKSTENIISIFTPSGQALGIHLDTITQNIVGVGTPIPFVNSSCRIIASLLPNGASPISGSVTAKEWIESSQAPNYLKRHYEITPATGAGTATGKVTLYFTQTEFNDFNNQSPAPALLLPQNPTDNTGKANLKVEKRGGISSDGTGLPNTYGGTIETIDPTNTDIVWNGPLDRWEVSFSVTGFSGFFLKTQSNPLPIELLSFTGKNKGSYNQLEWRTASEINNTGFDIERSDDGTRFEKIGFVPSKGKEANTYTFKDEALQKNLYYYRLKQIDTDQKYTYSNVVVIRTLAAPTISVSPNPSTGIFRIQGMPISDREVVVSNALGQPVQTTIRENEIDLTDLPAGVYHLNVQGESFKLVKK